MSDSLVLTGVKDIKNQTGTEMLRLNPKRGGDTFQLKRWWTTGGNGTVYEDATVFNVTTTAGVCKLAIASTENTNIRIAHDGEFGFLFSQYNEVSYAALYTDAFELIEYYVFPSQSGGKIMTVTPAGGGSKPVPDVALSWTSTGSVTGTMQVGAIVTVTAASYTGGIGSTTLANLLQVGESNTGPWTFLATNTNTSYTYTLQPAQEGKYIRQSTQVTDDTGLKVRNGSASLEIQPA